MVDTWRIEKYNLYLEFLISIDPWDRSLGGLGTWGYSTDALSDESIEAGRLSGIGSADDGDVSDFRHV